MERITHLKNEGNGSFKLEQYEKASYYYAQALLIFYYLIPEDEKQEQESNSLKRICHRNQAICHMRNKRLNDAMQEIE